MKIFLTGGTGMVGRNLLTLNRMRAHDVYAPSRQEVNLADARAIRRAMNKFRPDIIVHAAGKVGGIDANRADPWSFMVENLAIGLNVITTAKETGVGRLLNIASSCIYPSNHSGHLTEEMLLTGPLEPTNEAYAIAKIVSLKMCTYAQKPTHASGVYKSIIPCNIFGPFDNFHPTNAHLLPAIIRKVHEARLKGDHSVEIWGDGSARREFMFAGDLADVILEACERYNELPMIMNVGTGVDFSVREYYEAARLIIGWEGDFTFDLSRPVGMRRKVVDISRQTEWGWQPRVTLHDGIALTYHAFLNGKVR